MRISVQLLPGREPVRRDSVAVVIDVLRATTTLTVALEHGAARIVPVGDLDAARAIAARTPGALLSGERYGRIVPGFDLGNSPFEYTRERIGGRTLVFASTNGAPALVHAAPARERVLGAFVNASAVVERVARAGHVTLLCAGAVGRFSLEDVAFAGWVARRLVDRGGRLDGVAADVAARIAPRDAGEIRALVQGSSNGRELRRLGPEYAADVAFCAELDRLETAFAI